MSKKLVTNWKTFIRGLVGAVVGGGANAICVMVVKPEAFNFAAGWSDLWHFTVISAVVSAALYLKQNPVPPEELEDVDTNPPFKSSPPVTPPSQ